MELAGLSRDPDPTLVRHIYDLHMMRALVDPSEVTILARAIAESDAREFCNQHPAYAANIAGETRKAVAALQDNVVYRQRYEDFQNAMVYGEKIGFVTTIVSVALPAGEIMVR
jgi:4-hydroxyphenylpyruvate dioxygenase-like putative hemolysin